MEELDETRPLRNRLYATKFVPPVIGNAEK